MPKLCVNPSTNLAQEQDMLASAQGPAKRSNVRSNEAPTPPKAPTSYLVLLSAKDLFTKFMKIFMETTQAQTLAEPRDHPLKAKTPKTYWDKSHMECYYFYQQCEDHFETSGATWINYTPFAASFLCGSISLRWAQHKCYHKSATPIT